jgi:hypothetical protein
MQRFLLKAGTLQEGQGNANRRNGLSTRLYFRAGDRRHDFHDRLFRPAKTVTAGGIAIR